MARRYNRDSRGRFASGGGGGGSRRPAARGISRGTNRLTRDNSGRITSVGGDGATARGGRLRTASGKQRATQTLRAGRRSTPSGAIRKTDVVTARTQNAISKNIERRNRAGLNPPTASKENQSARIARAERRIASRPTPANPTTRAAAAAVKPVRRGGLPSTAIRERSISPSKRPNMRTRDLTQFSTTVYGVPTRSNRLGTRTVGPGGKITSAQAVKPQTRKDRRVYTSTANNVSSRTVVQRMKDGNYAVTRTDISPRAGGGVTKGVRTDVRRPEEMARVLRSTVQGAQLGGRKRVGTRRVARRVA